MTSLRIVLRCNAISCLGFGGLFLAAPIPVAGYLGDVPPSAIVILGIILLANGLHLLLASARRVLLRTEVIWFSLGDLLWWLASLGLLAGRIWITSNWGVLTTWLVAVAVAGMGLAQLWFLGRNPAGLDTRDYCSRIARSWLAIPAWVKLWLFALNGAFVAVLIFVPSDLSRVVLISYVASGPLLLAFLFFEGGVSRLSGLGHLIPWIPMLLWLFPWLRQPDPTSPETAYVWTLVLVVSICLALDVNDFRRWLRGERGIFGVRHAPAH